MTSEKPLCKYVVDTSVIIDMNRHYSPEFFSDLWDRIVELADQERWIIPSKVVSELRDEPLKEWIKTHEHAVAHVAERHQAYVEEILSLFPRLIDPNRPIEDADPWLIAHAACLRDLVPEGSRAGFPIVLTSERPASHPESLPKIPNVCEHYKLRCTNIFGFFRQEEWTFRLAPRT